MTIVEAEAAMLPKVCYLSIESRTRVNRSVSKGQFIRFRPVILCKERHHRRRDVDVDDEHRYVVSAFRRRSNPVANIDNITVVVSRYNKWWLTSVASRKNLQWPIILLDLGKVKLHGYADIALGRPETNTRDSYYEVAMLAPVGRNPPYRNAVLAITLCAIACSSVVGPAMTLGYSAVALESLTSPKTGMNVSESQQSWIASIAAIAIPLGCILSSAAMRHGRRFSMIGTSVVSMIGWLIIYYSSNVEQILAGRAISGVAVGLASTPSTVYAAEIASPKLRGVVVTWTSVSIALGILIVYIFGYICQDNWRLIALLCCIFPVLSAIAVITKLPESPVWLRSRGRGIEAEITLKQLRGLANDGTVPDTLNESKFEDIEDAPWRGICDMSTMKPLLIMTGYFFFQQFSGIFVVIYYAINFTIEAGVRLDGHVAAILIGLTRLLATMAVSWISRKYGRRRPSIASGLGMTVCMSILSAYVYLDETGYGLSDHGAIPVTAIVAFILTSTLGFAVVPFAMIGEVYPAKFKELLSGLTTCLAYLFSFCILKIYPDMLRATGKHGVFLFYAVVAFFGTLFVTFFLPETKGKTLEEIEDMFGKKRSRNQEIGIVTKC